MLFLVSLFGLCVALQDHHHFEHGWSRWGNNVGGVMAFNNENHNNQRLQFG